MVLVTLVGCTYDGPPEVKTPYYMTKLADSPGWSSEYDFLNLDIEGHLLERGYGPSSPDSLILSNCYVDNWGSPSGYIERVHMNFAASVKGELYPNAPFKIGDDWSFNDSTTIPITDVYMTGIGVAIALPKSFEKNLKYGFYKLTNSRVAVGVSIYNRWFIKAEDAVGKKHYRNYLLYMQRRGKRKVEITGIDTSKTAEIRITAEFEGVFAADRFLVEEMGKEFELEEKGSFSFTIKK